MSLTPGHNEDPDAQATITEFLDYTEYLPSDVTRSLSLIGQLDEAYVKQSGNVHKLAQEYGSKNKSQEVGAGGRDQVRHDLSSTLAQAVRSREAAFVEALRLDEMIRRHATRLNGIITKLRALPKPPSRDPTPAPRSPLSNNKSPPPRIRLLLEGNRVTASASRVQDKHKHKHSHKRRVTVPGEVLPPLNGASSPASSTSDWADSPTSPFSVPRRKNAGSTRNKRDLESVSSPALDSPVNGDYDSLSTSNALLMLPKPPANAKIGGEHAPWTRLTDYELAVLRKKMKKNVSWLPTETMVERELADAGRGIENYRKMKAEADARGEELLDYDAQVARKCGTRGERGRKALLEASLQDTQVAIMRFHELGTNFKDIFKKNGSLRSANSPALSRLTPTQSRMGAAKSKRYHTSTDPRVAAVYDKSSSKKRKRAECSRRFDEEEPGHRKRSRRGHGRDDWAQSASPPAHDDGTGRKKLTLRGPAFPGALSNSRRSSRQVSPGPPSSTGATQHRSRRPIPASVLKLHVCGRNAVGQQQQQAHPLVDPNEPRYCLCNDVSYGEMIGCDNDACEKQWFHFKCVGLTEHPPRRTKWFCPDCRRKMKK